MAKLSIPIFWRVRKHLYTLEGRKCLECGRTHFPPKSSCPYCGSTKLIEYYPPKKGKLLVWTKLYETCDDRSAYRPIYIGLLQLGELRVVLPLTDIYDEGKLKPGIDVELVLRRYVEDGDTGLIYYGLKARPII